MGLTLHHRFHAPSTLTDQAAKRVVQQWHALAEKLAEAGRVTRVLPISEEPEDLERWATVWKTHRSPGDEHSATGIQVPPLAGAIFPVEIGEDCELLWMGLCRYPAVIEHAGLTLPTELGDGWHFSRACKTQYASLHGWEHFRRCHLAVIDLLQFGWCLGVNVTIEDEGGYWPACDEARLRRELNRMNRVVAAMAGALKDEAEAAEKPDSAIDSPIFRHPQFEQLEAEGNDEHRAAVEAAIRAWRHDQNA